MTTRTSTHPLRWGDTPDSPKRDGLKINRNGRWMFIPDSELFDLASQIIDHLDRLRARSTDTPVPEEVITAYSTSTTTEGTTR